MERKEVSVCGQLAAQHVNAINRDDMIVVIPVAVKLLLGSALSAEGCPHNRAAAAQIIPWLGLSEEYG
jgi:hypothetical protein